MSMEKINRQWTSTHSGQPSRPWEIWTQTVRIFSAVFIDVAPSQCQRQEAADVMLQRLILANWENKPPVNVPIPVSHSGPQIWTKTVGCYNCWGAKLMSAQEADHFNVAAPCPCPLRKKPAGECPPITASHPDPVRYLNTNSRNFWCYYYCCSAKPMSAARSGCCNVAVPRLCPQAK